MAPTPLTSTALLVMDVQRGVVERYAEGPAGQRLLDRLAQAIGRARETEVLVVYVVVRFREGFPEISPRNRAFSALSQGGLARFGEGDSATLVHPDIAPRPDEPVVVKKRVSAFAGSDLEVLLRSRSITHLVLCGIATSGVVLSTLRAAADLDYELTVLSDGCLDMDEEVHRVLLEKVFARQAAVVDVAAWVEGLAP